MSIYLRPTVAAEMRLKYEVVARIPGHRWTTSDGQFFLSYLTTQVERYGQRQVAGALGIPQQTVSWLCRRHDPLAATDRIGIYLAELREAHLLVQRWRSLRRLTRRHHETYRRMHEALAGLLVVYPLGTVARLSGISARELKKFMDIPTATDVFDDVKLMLLLQEYDAGRGLEPARRRRFLQVLEEALAGHDPDVVASLLQVRSAVVRNWMIEKVHGKPAT